MKRLLLLVALVSLSTLASDDTFIDRKNGVTLVKPSGWEISPELSKQAGNQAGTKQRVVEIVKYSAGHEGPIPSFVMWVQPVPFVAREFSPATMLRQMLNGLGRALPDMTVESMPRDVPVWDLHKVTQLDGGEMRLRYTARDATGHAYEARSRMMYVRRGEQLFSIQTTSPASGPDASNAELDDVISSLRIAR